MTEQGKACRTLGGPRAASDLKFSGHVAFRKTQPLYPNRYAGTCGVCGHPVPAGAGYVERRGTGWGVLH